MALGDRNTKFYHITTVTRRCHNKVNSLKLSNGTVYTDPNMLKLHARDFYQEMFPKTTATQYTVSNTQLASLSHYTLSQMEQLNLVKPIEFWETTKAIKSILPHKAPRPDGYQLFFIQKYWAIVGSSIHKLVAEAFSMGKFEAKLNNTLHNYESKPGELSTWRGLLKSMNIVRGGYCWSLENGKDISLWFDAWVENKPLCLMLDDINPIQSVWTIAYILEDDDHWNMGSLCTVIPTKIKHKIFLLQPHDVEDKLTWKGNNGVATTKVLYNFLISLDDEPQQPFWRWIWKLMCPQKLCFFIWLIMHNKPPQITIVYTLAFLKRTYVLDATNKLK